MLVCNWRATTPPRCVQVLRMPVQKKTKELSVRVTKDQRGLGLVMSPNNTIMQAGLRCCRALSISVVALRPVTAFSRPSCSRSAYEERFC